MLSASHANRVPCSKAREWDSRTFIHPFMWFLHDGTGWTLCCLAHGELAWLLLEPYTGLDHCPIILLSGFRARISGHVKIFLGYILKFWLDINRDPCIVESYFRLNCSGHRQLIVRRRKEPGCINNTHWLLQKNKQPLCPEGGLLAKRTSH